jgi:hypothetical protein
MQNDNGFIQTVTVFLNIKVLLLQWSVLTSSKIWFSKKGKSWHKILVHWLPCSIEHPGHLNSYSWKSCFISSLVDSSVIFWNVMHLIFHVMYSVRILCQWFLQNIILYWKKYWCHLGFTYKVFYLLIYLFKHFSFFSLEYSERTWSNMCWKVSKFLWCVP